LLPDFVVKNRLRTFCRNYFPASALPWIFCVALNLYHKTIGGHLGERKKASIKLAFGLRTCQENVFGAIT
jgi:hypothetical protein